MQAMEEKQLESCLEALIQRVSEVKNSLGALIFKIENGYETLNWPTVLDSFALLSAKLNSLGRIMKSDKVPSLKNQLVLPLVLSQEMDEHLEKLTEGRLLNYNHEVAPNYLRTKAEPDVEEKMHQLSSKAQQIPQELAQKQLQNLNKFTSNVLDIIDSTREDWDKTSQKAIQPQTSSVADTNTLISTVLCGKNIKARGHMTDPPQSVTQQQQQQAKMQQNPVMTKAPSSLKVNIKSGSSNHPYQRP